MHRISEVQVLAGVFWHPVTKGYRVAARRGGKLPEVNDSSVTLVNSIRPVVVASLHPKGEAQMTHDPNTGRPPQGGPVSPACQTPERCRDDDGWLETEGSDGSVTRRRETWMASSRCSGGTLGTEEPTIQESERP